MTKYESSLSLREVYDLIREELTAGGTVSFTPNGSSMLPLIRGGKDRITLSPLPPEVKVGAVLFYRRENGDFVLHRLVKREKEKFIFCGDNQFSLEKGIDRGALLALMTGLERNGKSISLSSQIYRLYCALLPCRRIYLRLRHALARALRRITKRNQR